MAKPILVTGGNAGIGLALCQQLLVDHGCQVFMGSRNPEKGASALSSLALPAEVAARCSVVQLDACSEESIKAAAATVQEALKGEPLYAVVNNAGAGLAHGVSEATVLDTNLRGPRRVVDAFLPLLDQTLGRIVNVGSGAGGGYVKKLGESDEARMLMKGDATYEELEAYATGKLASGSLDGMGSYGCSKACLAAWTQQLAKLYPNITSSCLSPGFINTNMVKGFGATKTPAEGTLALKKCLFEKLSGNGWYYGSDGERSPYHFMRSPGEPPYDGVMPF